MKRWMITLLAVASLAAGTAQAVEDEAALEQRLEDAQRRLEDAAREVAEISTKMSGPGEAREFELMRQGQRRAMLGVNLDDGDGAGRGVRVGGVSPGGPAAEAGVKAGDVIVAIQSKPVATGRDIVRAMEGVKPGDTVALGIERGGKPMKLSVEARPVDPLLFPGVPATPAVPALPALAAMPAMAAMPFEGDMHWLLDDWGDAEFVTVTPELGRYFGTEKGVLVAHAPEDASLGLKDGDVIVAIGGREPQSGRHAMRILRSYQPGESVDLRILRDRKAQTLSPKIPERDGGDMRDLPRRPPPPPRRAPAVVPAPAAPPAPEAAAPG